jgi:hypothetical protein
VRWQIGLDTAKKTLDATTQLAIRDFSTTTGGRRLKPSYTYQLKYPRLNVEMYMDTLIGRDASPCWATPWLKSMPHPYPSIGLLWSP